MQSNMTRINWLPPPGRLYKRAMARTDPETRAARREWLVLAEPSQGRALARRPASHQEMTDGS